MTTNQIAQKLNVSPSTVKRWAKLLEIEPQKNAKGHFIYSEKEFRAIQSHFLSLQTSEASPQMIANEENFQRMEEKICELERRLDKKADDVTSYQLLNHRNEIDDLLSLVDSLDKRITLLEKELSSSKEIEEQTEMLVSYPKRELPPNRKGRKLLHFMFGMQHH